MAARGVLSRRTNEGGGREAPVTESAAGKEPPNEFVRADASLGREGPVPTRFERFGCPRFGGRRTHTAEDRVMRVLMIVITALMGGAGFLSAHAAGEVPAALAARLAVLAPGAEPDHVSETRMAGIYEVRYGSIVVYLSEDGRYMLRGDLMDLETGRNVTEGARSTARAETVGALGEENMIVFAPESVKHTVTVFTDVDCGYCARLHRQMADYNRLGIKIRYTAFPRAGVGSETYDKMVSVWCASDPHTAMTDAKAGRSIAAARCDNPVSEQYEAGRAIGVRGTPAMVLESGEMIPGYVPPEELASRLDQGVSG